MTSTDAIICGIGQTDYRRRNVLPLGRLIANAVNDALQDAGIVPSDVDTIFTEGSTMPLTFPIDRFASSFGFSNVEHHGYFGTGGSGLFYAALQAATLIKQGLSKAAVVYFGIDWGSQSSGPYAYHEKFPSKQLWERPHGFFGQPVYYGAMARRYQIDYGLHEADVVDGLASFAIASRNNALRNPTSQMTEALTHNAYFAARPIADPLRFYDCCLISDAAGCIVILPAERCTRKGAKIISGAYREEQTDEDSFYSQSPGYLRLIAAQKSAKAAFEKAEIASARSADFVNVYDCFTISALLQLEAIGWSGPGESIFACGSGKTEVDGATPVNTHGGLLSNGYLLGFNHMIEAVRQLRGEAGEGQVKDARTGILTASPSRHHTTLVLGAAG